jgi:hypothetical protein
MLSRIDRTRNNLPHFFIAYSAGSSLSASWEERR